MRQNQIIEFTLTFFIQSAPSKCSYSHKKYISMLPNLIFYCQFASLSILKLSLETFNIRDNFSQVTENIAFLASSLLLSTTLLSQRNREETVRAIRVFDTCVHACGWKRAFSISRKYENMCDVLFLSPFYTRYLRDARSLSSPRRDRKSARTRSNQFLLEQYFAIALRNSCRENTINVKIGDNINFGKIKGNLLTL